MINFEHIYIHIPFCHRICHYCDFTKTARFDDESKKLYLESLINQINAIKDICHIKPKSIFFGGGTPSVYKKEIGKILKVFDLSTYHDIEITLETNPEDLISENINAWLDAGVNRFSIGCQSFNDKGLRVLTREHRSKDLNQKLDDFFAHISQSNIQSSFDLIYGWPGHTLDDWMNDLKLSLQYPIDHLSTYCLGYEPTTVLGRKYQRECIPGIINEDTLELLYTRACSFLSSHKFAHYEISNFARKGKHQSIHNTAYWTDKNYLAFGIGAHGYFKSPALPHGIRYKNQGSLRAYLKNCFNSSSNFVKHFENNLWNYSLEQNRNAATWLKDRIITGLRYYKGISIAELELYSKLVFKPTTLLQEGLDREMILCRVDQDSSQEFLVLSEKEWFRENAWIHEFVESFQ